MNKNKTYVILVTLTVLLACFLSFYSISKSGYYGNAYYTSAVRSMMQNFHNFFYASFDPAGFENVDKPPVALWIQTIFALVFGFHTWSVILPETISAAVSILIVSHLVKRRFGKTAGIISAVSMACTPIFIALSRSNNVDSILILDMLIGTYMIIKASETGKVKFLLISMVFAGIGFNIKMLAAYMVLPAFFITYIFSQRKSLKKNIVPIFISFIILLAVSASWITAVDLTPTQDRPYIVNSKTNSEIDLVLNYNGINRVLPGLFTKSKKVSNTVQTFHELGSTGFLRLFDKEVGGQVSFLMPIVLLGLLSSLLLIKKRESDEYKKTNLLFWVSCFIPLFIYFSFSKGYTHRYYLGILVPCISALTGIGISSLLKLYKEDGFVSYLLPITLFLNTIFQIKYLSYYASWCRPLIIITATVGTCASLFLVLAKLLKSKFLGKYHMAIFSACFLCLIAAPLVWSSTPIIYNTINGSNPFAGPELEGTKNKFTLVQSINKMFKRKHLKTENSEEDSTIEFLKDNSSDKYLAATISSGEAQNIIIKTGLPVMAIGGFSGSSKIITLDQFKNMIKTKKVKYFLITSSSKRKFNSDILKWVTKNSALVTINKYDLTHSKESYKVYDLTKKTYKKI